MNYPNLYPNNPNYLKLVSDIEKIMSETFFINNVTERIFKIQAGLDNLVQRNNLYNYLVKEENGIMTIYFRWKKALEIDIFDDTLLLPFVRRKKLQRILNDKI
jgi:hypothetical protein